MWKCCPLEDKPCCLFVRQCLKWMDPDVVLSFIDTKVTLVSYIKIANSFTKKAALIKIQRTKKPLIYTFVPFHPASWQTAWRKSAYSSDWTPSEPVGGALNKDSCVNTIISSSNSKDIFSPIVTKRWHVYQPKGLWIQDAERLCVWVCVLVQT